MLKIIESNVIDFVNKIAGIFLILVLLTFSSVAQSPYCGSNTPYFTVDLRNNSDSLWISPSVRRNDLCCGIDPTETPPVRCVQFGISLDEDAVGIIFNIESGAIPPGAIDYSIDCGLRGYPGSILCLDGPWPKFLTFCKPGFNPNEYSIKSVPGPKITPPVIVSDGCTQTLTVTGLEQNTIKWTSVPSDPILESYLNCTSGCPTVVASYRPGAPDSITYQASGIIVGACAPKAVSKRTKVYFINNKEVNITPIDPKVCFGFATTKITANATGGKRPYKYLWSTGESTQSINVKEGTYSVYVSDASSCPGTSDTVIVTSFKLPILAKAGPDQIVCNDTMSVQVKLNGIVEAVKSGIWSGGTGTFSPMDTTLNAVYFPSASELKSGKSLLYLTTTGNAECPSHTDSILVTYPLPVPFKVNDVLGCTGSAVTMNAPDFGKGSYTWYRNGGVVNNVFQYNTVSDTSFTVEILYKTALGCKSRDTAIANVFQKPVIALDDVLICEDKMVNLPVKILNSSLAPVKYIWSRNGFKLPDTTSSINTKQAGSYRIVYSSGACQVQDDAEIRTYAIKVNAGPDGVLCRLSGTRYQLNGSKLNSNTIKWSGGKGIFEPSDTTVNPIYNVDPSEVKSTSLNLVIETTGNSGCKEPRDSVKILLRMEPLAKATGDTVCTGEKGNVISKLNPDIKYEWKDENGAVVSSNSRFDIIAFSNRYFFLKTTDTLNCTDTSSANIRVYPKPEVQLKDTTACEGDVVTLKGVVIKNTVPNGNYQWTTNNVLYSEFQNIQVFKNGSFYLKYGLGNCTGSGMAKVQFAQKPLVEEPAVSSFCVENIPFITLDAGVYNFYEWLPDMSGGKTFKVYKEGNYTVKVYNEHKCVNQKTFIVKELCPPRLFVPNAFTPGASNNSRFDVKEAFVKKYQMLIFNRWGEIIFESTNPYISWDGIYRGESMPVGVYPWTVNYEGEGEFKGPYKKQGSVTLIR